MKSPRFYQDKASKAEELARDPRQRAEVCAELRAMARRWRQSAEQADWRARERGTGR
jgi:hypothetical protein